VTKQQFRNRIYKAVDIVQNRHYCSCDALLEGLGIEWTGWEDYSIGVCKAYKDVFTKECGAYWLADNEHGNVQDQRENMLLLFLEISLENGTYLNY